MTHLSRFDLNLLVVFEAIYSQGGITRAAEQLNLTQSAISHALGRLREGIGDKLFVREGQIMLPTSVAQELIAPVRRALSEIDGSLRQVRLFDPAQSGRHFKIGLRGFLETVTFVPIVKHLRTRAEGVSLNAVRYNRLSLSSALASGDLDVAIDVDLAGQGALQRRLLWRGRMVVVMRRGHPALGGVLDMDAYLSQAHIIASSRRKGDSLEDMILRHMGRVRQVRARCHSPVTAGRLVAESDMMLTVPESYAHMLRRLYALEVRPAPFDGASSDLYLYWHEHMHKDAANLWLRTQIGDCLDALFPEPFSALEAATA